MPVPDTSGLPIHYDLAGSGPPLVLLHGFVGDSTIWRHAGYVDALAGQFTLVLVDARGRGRSGKPHYPAMYATQRLAADVLAVLDDLGVDRAGIWGQSLGGRAGLILAIHHPGRLRALVAGATRAQASPSTPPRSRPRCAPSASTAWRASSPTWRPPGRRCRHGCGR
jgi:pimeloyl-ACP methyl ester carboxylesterase